jgi:hypothetical protein
MKKQTAVTYASEADLLNAALFGQTARERNRSVGGSCRD